jgi:predicted RNA-binding protein with PIN domain
MGRDILVDGYNVIKNSEPFRSAQKHGLSHARMLLIKQLISKYRHTPHQVTVVFDGDGVHEQITHEQRLRIVFSRRGETADRVIMRLAAQACEAGREVETISNDLEVRQSVTKSGGEVRATKQLTQELNAPPPDVGQKFQHRQKTIRDYGLNPALKAEDDEDFYGSPRKGRKPPRRRK